MSVKIIAPGKALINERGSLMPGMARDLDPILLQRRERGGPLYDDAPYVSIAQFASESGRAAFDLLDGESARVERGRTTRALKSVVPGKRVKWLRADGRAQAFVLIDPRDPNTPKRERKPRKVRDLSRMNGPVRVREGEPVLAGV